MVPILKDSQKSSLSQPKTFLSALSTPKFKKSSVYYLSLTKILSNFNALSAGRPRREYLNELKGHLRTYYDYN